MPDPKDDLDRWIDSSCQTVSLDIPDACRPGVRTFLTVARDMAAILDTVPLDEDELALAPVFTPPEIVPEPTDD